MHRFRCSVQFLAMDQTANAHVSSVQTPTGLVIVFTKTKYLMFFKLPRTRVTHYQGPNPVKGASVSIRYNTADPQRLDQLHGAVVQAVADIGIESFKNSAVSGPLPFRKQSQHLLRFVERVA